MGIIQEESETTIESLYNKTTKKERGTVHHYTSYQSMVSIIKNRSFQFTRIDLLNDKTEERFAACQDDEVMYVLSFTNTSKESVAMWMLYGSNVGMAGTKVRISIPRGKLIDAFQYNFFFDATKNNRIPNPSIISGKGALSKKNYSMRDVVYIDRRNGKIRFNGRSYTDRLQGTQIEELFKGFIKYDALEFEAETRIAVLLKRDNIIEEAPAHIYAGIDDNVLRAMKITTDPWISEDMKTVIRDSLDSLAGINLDYHDSILEGEVLF